LLGYEFFFEGREFHLDPDPLAEKRYLAKLDDLAKDIHTLLQEINGGSTNPKSEAASHAATSVYLAWATTDRADDRDSIKRELVDRNFEVFPKSDPPLDANAFAYVVQTSLDRCDYSIHPIGARFGMVPEGDNRSITWLQHELAAQRYQRGSFRRVLWMPRGLEVQDPPQKAFIDHLKDELGGPQNGFEFLETPLEELKTIVLKQLATGAAPAQPQRNGSEQSRIYIMYERKDHEAIKPIEDFLSDKDFAVELPTVGGDRKRIAQDHRDMLASCDGALIYCGSGSDEWIKEKLRDIRRAPGWGREKPAPTTAVIGPQLSRIRGQYQDDDNLLFCGFESFFSQALDPFLAKMLQLNRMVR
jgi:hypothetical protein